MHALDLDGGGGGKREEETTIVADSKRSGRHLIGINCQELHQGAIITMCVAAICLSSLPHVPCSRPRRIES